MTAIPATTRTVLATENGGNNWLLFHRKDAIVQGTYAEVVKLRDELERGR